MIHVLIFFTDTCHHDDVHRPTHSTLQATVSCVFCCWMSEFSQGTSWLNGQSDTSFVGPTWLWDKSSFETTCPKTQLYPLWLLVLWDNSFLETTRPLRQLNSDPKASGLIGWAVSKDGLSRIELLQRMSCLDSFVVVGQFTSATIWYFNKGRSHTGW